MKTTTATELVNPERLFSVVKRLFPNSEDEILGELLQNSRRAGATRIDIQLKNNIIRIIDNGAGIPNGEEGFRTLLSIADSHYSEEVERNQSPMGIGFYSLLSHEKILEVCVRSGRHTLTIDPKKWFSDAEYRTNWRDQLSRVNQPHVGTVVEAICLPNLFESFKSLFVSDWYSKLQYIPAWVGHARQIPVTLNGDLLPQDLPEFLKPQPLFETEYLGNRLIVGLVIMAS